VIGPVLVSRHSYGKANRHRIRLDDGAVLNIDRATYARLVSLGQLRQTGDLSDSWESLTQSERLVLEHEVPTATVSYEPTGPLLLEIRDPDGEPLYRDPAFPQGLPEIG
jgi:hypothetical protein